MRMKNFKTNFNLDGKLGLITGAAGLLGYEHAYALLEIGSKVVLTDINKNKLKQVKSKLTEIFNKNDIYIKYMDVSSEKSINSVASELTNQSLRVDILINNAAIDSKFDKSSKNKKRDKLEFFSLYNWNQELKVGLTGYFLCSKIFGTKMSLDNLGGVILNIASDLSVISPDNRIYRNKNKDLDKQPVKPITYPVIKTGIVGMTRYLSTYWAKKGIRANALSPGGVYTSQNEEFVKNITNLIPIGRMAKKDEYRSAVQFLCSNASSYMTGQNIVIDGGRSVW